VQVNAFITWSTSWPKLASFIYLLLQSVCHWSYRNKTCSTERDINLQFSQTVQARSTERHTNLQCTQNAGVLKEIQTESILKMWKWFLQKGNKCVVVSTWWVNSSSPNISVKFILNSTVHWGRNQASVSLSKQPIWTGRVNCFSPVGASAFLFILGCWIAERSVTTCYICEYKRKKHTASEYHNTQ